MEWNYIIRIFRNFGFSEKWCDLISECISTVKSTVLLNGIPGIPFNPTRGLRQGDPLYPYLFITALEGLSRLFYQAEQDKTFARMQINKRCPVISHLLFADDCFIFCKENIAECFEFPVSVLEKFDRIQRDFWWNKNNPKKAYYPKAWCTVYTPRSCGGLGIRNPHKMNVSLLSKLAWRLLNNPNDLWIRTSIRKGIEIIKENSIWEIGSGTNVQIAKDNWIPKTGIFNNWQHEDLVYVSDLTDIDGQWNKGLIDFVFPETVASKIKAIYINTQNQNKLRWLGNRNGEFSTKSAYKIISREDHITNDKIWHMKLIPRVSLFTWKMTADVLPLRAKMNDFLKHTELFCLLCKKNILETSAHLFISCNFTRAVWFGLGLQIPAYDGNFLNWVMSWFSKALWDYKEVFSIICWKIWNYRNDVNFKKLDPNPLDCIKEIRDFLKQCDSYSETDGSFGIGIVFWLNNKVADINFLSGTITGSAAAEALALQQTVRWEKELKINNLRIKADCMDAVIFLNNRASTCDWRSIAILKDVHILLGNFEHVDISYVNRKNNGEADKLARWSRKKQKYYIIDNSNILLVKNKILNGIVNRHNILIYSC
ncbi:uncharacterized protein LOC113315995 [Papaver somniferum]|uniref:uncharacterized protein LOC113315995 n=1 Tax=Papaver somniferum TaxID=3469 RepID=UPI000E6F519F|nr:uncharacterized protein LOC113315995 [Papaver somniferum]